MGSDAEVRFQRIEFDPHLAGGVNSAHTILEIGAEKTVEVGDEATLIGPDHPAILPHTIAEKTDVGFLRIIQGMNQRLPRKVV